MEPQMHHHNKYSSYLRKWLLVKSSNNRIEGLLFFLFHSYPFFSRIYFERQKKKKILMDREGRTEKALCKTDVKQSP